MPRPFTADPFTRRIRTVVYTLLLALPSFLSTGARPAAGATDKAPFTFETLQHRARELAAQPYKDPAIVLPPELAALDYDQHRDIRFKPGSLSFDREAPFQLQFFHLGFLLKEPVKLFHITDGRTVPIPFKTSLFDYGKNTGLEDLPDDLGFAGMRIHYALNRPDYMDELAVFAGASYFRSLAAGQVYGLSARGLAVDTGEPTGEIFPRFSEFHFVDSNPGDRECIVYALLDSPVVTGAYEFRIAPRESTVMDARATLYRRAGATITTLGIAPLTSMFWHGENSGTTNGDFRPEVHDSDGLLVHTGRGEWLWRPLQNPDNTRVSALADDSPKGFGLLQRDREFAHYQDLEAHYQRRPNLWIEPAGEWGEGGVRLVELHAPDETYDNVVAFWTPKQLPGAGAPIDVAYRMYWFGEQGGSPVDAAGGRTKDTRFASFVLDQPEQQLFVVDFELPALSEDSKALEAVVTVGDGARLIEQHVQPNTQTGAWRLSMRLVPDSAHPGPVEMRAYLHRGEQALTETWTYQWFPQKSSPE
ncbi:MAG: glucan biosynthesis protein [Opitutaceae bacterium]